MTDEELKGLFKFSALQESQPECDRETVFLYQDQGLRILYDNDDRVELITDESGEEKT